MMCRSNSSFRRSLSSFSLLAKAKTISSSSSFRLPATASASARLLSSARLSHSLTSIRLYSSTVTSSESKNPTADTEAPTTTTTAEAAAPQEQQLLYLGGFHQQFVVRTMFGVGTFNVLYWGAQMINHFIFKEVVVQGISIAGA
jgi:hypothetical protein